MMMGSAVATWRSMERSHRPRLIFRMTSTKSTQTSESLPSIEEQAKRLLDLVSSSSVSAGRTRKRSRSWLRRRQRTTAGFETVTQSKADSGATSRMDPRNTAETAIDDHSLPYPKGKPWRVLFPYPHGEPTLDGPMSWKDYYNKIPTSQQWREAWKKYKETWEDGIQGIPKKSSRDPSKTTTPTTDHLQEVGDNASRNLRIVRKDAQSLLENAKDVTGIRTQEDAKALASEAMKIATECIREFMAGYRNGRDSEIDKVLHEYFQDDEDESAENSVARKDSNEGNRQPQRTKSRRKRKPKRGIPRR